MLTLQAQDILGRGINPTSSPQSKFVRSHTSLIFLLSIGCEGVYWPSQEDLSPATHFKSRFVGSNHVKTWG